MQQTVCLGRSVSDTTLSVNGDVRRQPWNIPKSWRLLFGTRADKAHRQRNGRRAIEEAAVDAKLVHTGFRGMTMKDDGHSQAQLFQSGRVRSDTSAVKHTLSRRGVLWAATALACAAAFLPAFFVDVRAFGLPSLFYVPLVLAAMAGGRRAAVAAALALTALFVLALDPGVTSVAELTTTAAIRLAVSLLIGLLIASQVDHHRQLVGTAVRRADRDFLTGLGSRNALETHWAERERTARPFGVLMIDMDNLKEINDQSGHAAGDAALQALAGSVRRGSRSDDFTARIGGDEFVVITDIDNLPELESLASRIERDANNQDIAVSVGVAISPEDGSELADVMETADTRMYARKRARKAGMATLAVARPS